MGKKSFIDLTGKTFGSIFVISRAKGKVYDCPSGKYVEVRWNIRCDGGGPTCKKTTVMPTCQLRTRGAKSCGCLKSFKKESPINLLFSDYQNGAKARSLSFTLSKEEFVHLISSDCFYCGVSPQQKLKAAGLPHADFRYNGVDRLDNLVGYESDNVVPCCGNCNRLKSDRPLKEFLELIARVYEWQHRKAFAKGV